MMHRRKFLQYTGLATGSLFVPVWGKTVTAFGETAPVPAAEKKILADAALNAATQKGATYADVRIGRYLNQFIITRENKVENIVNTESYGVGVRVIADGCMGFLGDGSGDAGFRCEGGGRSCRHRQGQRRRQTDPIRPSQLAPQKGVWAR